MFSSQMVGGAKYIGGLSKSVASSVWSFFRTSQEEGLEYSSDENSDFESLDGPNVNLDIDGSRSLEDEWLQKYKDVQASLAKDYDSDYQDNVPSHLDLRCETQHHKEDYHIDRYSHESEGLLPLNQPSESSWQDKNNCNDGCNIHLNANSVKCSNQTEYTNHHYHESQTNSNDPLCKRQIKEANKTYLDDSVKHELLKENKTDFESSVETDLQRECTSHLENFMAKETLQERTTDFDDLKENYFQREYTTDFENSEERDFRQECTTDFENSKERDSRQECTTDLAVPEGKDSLQECTTDLEKKSVEKDSKHPTTDFNDSVGKPYWSENRTELNESNARTPVGSCVEEDSQESDTFAREMISGSETNLGVGASEKDIPAKENTKPCPPSHQIYRNLHLVILRPVRGVKVKTERQSLSHSKQWSSRFIERDKQPKYSAKANVNDSPHALEFNTGDTENRPTRTDMISDGSCHRNADKTFKRFQQSSASVSMDAETKGDNSEQKGVPYRVNATQRCLDNTEYLYSKLRAVYGECTDEAVREAVVQLNTKYSGYMLYFCDTFLDPALELIKTFKKNFQEPGCLSTFQWPVCCQGSIIIHLQDTKQLLPGQQYIYIRRSSGGQIQLAVKYCSLQGLRDVILRKNNEIANVLNMEWSNRFKMRSDEDLGKLLQRTMASFEDSIQRIKLEETADSCKDCKRNRQISDGKKVLLAVTNRSKFSNKPDGYYPQMNNDLQCNQPRSPGFYNHRTLDVPKTIMDVDYDLLQSGIAILPGCRDMRGGAVIFIFTGSSLWKNQQVSSSELARLLLYYRSVPREEVKQKGLTIVADVRGSNSSTINTLLEAIYLLEGNIPNCIASLLCVADLHTEPLVLKSPVYDKKASFKSCVLLSVEQLCDSIELDQLPLIFHGLFVYCHEDWVRFHMKLDPFLSKLRATAKYLICVMQDLSDVDVVPKNFDETTRTIKHHEESVKSALCDQRLISLQSDGKGIISDLQKEEEYMSHTEDYRDCMKAVDQLYIQLQNSMVKLVKLSENRLRKLEKCLHLREFEEESNKVISWLQSHGGQIADRYANLADNLKAIRSQQKDFEKFHFSAMSFIEKGNDLLEEASILAQSGDFDDATGYKELARTLKKHLQDFTQRLETTRERIESTTKCYHLLDKSYEWALEAMKYVASMKMDHSTTLEGLEKLLRSLELYLRHHPAMTEATFASMSELAQQLQNDKLLEQCRVAKARCVETNNLLNLRLGTLRRAKEKMLREQNLQPSNSFGSPHRSPGRTYAKDSNQMSQSYELGEGAWNPILSSTPAVPNRAIHPAFRKCVSEAAFSPRSGNSYITEDLSDHVVTSIPKVLNDTTLKSSREDLTEDSSESAQNNKNNNTEKLNNSLSTTNSTDFVFTPPYEPGNTLSSHNRPVKKMLKRTTVNSLDTSGVVQNGHISLQKRTSAPLPSNVIIEEDESKLSPPLRNPQMKALECRPVSMITVSTDSLSSLPEEEEENEENSCTSPQKRDWSKGVCGSPPTREWTPVPVNSHLSEFNRNVPTGSLAGLKLSGKESKSILAHVMCEMVQTERDYVQSLQYIIENYIPELLREDVPQALRGKRNVIFGNIEKIYQFHYQYFLKEVEMCEQKPFQISHYFLMHESFFYLYALYNKNKPKSDALMAEYGKHFFKQKQEELGDRMDLSSYLLKPVQRMGKYALMLKQIMKECPQSDAAYQDLKAAEQMVKFQLRHGNDLLAMDALKDCDVNLQEQGSLLRQDEFLVWQGRKKSLRHVFLFEDMILFSKTKRNRHGGPEYYVYKNSFKMADIGLTENYGESGYKFEIWFRRRNSGDNYIFQAPNSDVKHHWIRGISKILWNQALKNRDRHMTEMATMGIGNKPCLDIKPSANNIQDRFVNYALGGRGARTRNSIAVSSFDHSRLNNKRPHSIISIGSTSSSNSSHSGLFINPGAGGDPFDSPRHTTNTCLSNESGIGTDVSSSYIDQPSESFHKDMSPTHQYQSHNGPPPYHMTSQEIPPLAYSSTDV
ncbi:uncharacterized protein LOC127702659 isoform X3 [Mytilus californianus]|nr:uncharacterized protein LOC127702659 isoform X3 [Mytilus californianus]